MDDSPANRGAVEALGKKLSDRGFCYVAVSSSEISRVDGVGGTTYKT